MNQPHPSSARENRDTPPGWSYNPSAWRERWLLLALAAIGLLAALYTALSQLGVVGAMVDPLLQRAVGRADTARIGR